MAFSKEVLEKIKRVCGYWNNGNPCMRQRPHVFQGKELKCPCKHLYLEYLGCCEKNKPNGWELNKLKESKGE